MAKRTQRTARSASAKKSAPARKVKSGSEDLLTLDQIRQLFELMADNEVRAVDIRNGEMRLSVRRGAAPAVIQAAPLAPTAPAVATHVAPVASVDPPTAAAPPKADAGLIPITSPMVGTFYAAPDPESSPYVGIGSQVGTDTVVCIIEAMKVFNEIQADVAGTIEKVCVENGHPVEFGQALFLVRPQA